ncbi:VPLPA-CTERM sorting domain-containing protein [Oceanicoccus sp. KOV_DT_Chl]|uniref:VPLPA-CTERM sorting domain-containing protein n=1 Tax=Oceanicoccus sp. KOV_DT_Chl TaxID=1904639 RepID=UPI00190F0018|nr:VPLPA-CTERM sorting domain-containing protein [Oceanicoccus sp. KOV_DT_Chl]
MKLSAFFQQLSSSLVLLVVCSTASAALIPVNLAMQGTVSQESNPSFLTETQTGGGTGFYDTENDVLSYTYAITAVTDIYEYDLTGNSTLITATGAGIGAYTSCTNVRDDYQINICSYFSIGTDTPFQLSTSNIDENGNGILIFDFTTSDDVHYDIAYTVTSAVPVPAAAWLFGSGLVGLVGLKRKK